MVDCTCTNFPGALGPITFGASVGIGTTTPLANLHVAGSTGLHLRSSAGSPEGGRLTFFGDGTGWRWELQARKDDGTLVGSPILTAVDNGNVGLGTTSPTQQLTLTANLLLPTAVGNTAGNLFLAGDTSAGSNGLRLFSVDSAGGGFIDVKASAAANGLIFRADTSLGGTERMRITAGGNVGIGTTTPQATLDVSGQVNVGSLTAGGHKLADGNGCYYV